MMVQDRADTGNTIVLNLSTRAPMRARDVHEWTYPMQIILIYGVTGPASIATPRGEKRIIGIGGGGHRVL
jgi:hypothetical protein